MLSRINKVKVEAFARLMDENPDLDILCMVESEVVCGDEYNRWGAVIGGSRVDEVYIDGESIKYKSKHFSEMVKEEQDKLFTNNPKESLSEMQLEGLLSAARSAVVDLPWRRVIVLNIDI